MISSRGSSSTEPPLLVVTPSAVGCGAGVAGGGAESPGFSGAMLPFVVVADAGFGGKAEVLALVGSSDVVSFICSL